MFDEFSWKDLPKNPFESAAAGEKWKTTTYYVNPFESAVKELENTTTYTYYEPVSCEANPEGSALHGTTCGR